MKGRRELKGILAMVLSLSIVLGSLGMPIPVNATDNVDGEVVESTEPTAVPDEVPEGTETPDATPTAEPVEKYVGFEGTIKYGESTIAKDTGFLLVFTDGSNVETAYNIASGEDGKYAITPDVSNLGDGTYSVSVKKQGFVCTTPELSVQILNGKLVAPAEGTDVITLDIAVAVAELDVTADGSAWIVNGVRQYQINNYSSDIVYSVTVEGLSENQENVLSASMENGIVKVTPLSTAATGKVVKINAIYNANTVQSYTINVEDVKLRDTSVNIALVNKDTDKVSKQELKVSVGSISIDLPGTVTLSCEDKEGNAVTQGTFYVLKNGQEVECKDGTITLSEYADASTGSFICYYVATGVYKNYGFDGELKFVASYSGQEYVYGPSAGSVSSAYNTVHPIYFVINGNSKPATTDEMLVKYGDEDIKVPVDAEMSEIDGYTSTYTYQLVDTLNNPVSDDADVPYTVDENGNVTIKRANTENETYRIKVTRTSVKNTEVPEETENTEETIALADVSAETVEASAYLELKVEPKQIAVNIEESTFEAEKQYDNTTALTISSTEDKPLNISFISGSIEADDQVSVKSISGEVTNKNANEEGYKDEVLTVKSIELDGADKDNYIVNIDDTLKLKGSLIITRRPIGLIMSDASKEYNKSVLSPVEAEALVTVDGEPFITGENSDGVNLDSIVLPAAKIAWNEGQQDAVGEFEAVVVPDIDENGTVTAQNETFEAVKNYKFVVVKNGNLSVVAEKIDNVWSYISTNDTVNYKRENNGAVSRWISYNGTIDFNIDCDAYDAMILVGEDGTETLISDTNNFAPTNLAESGEYKYTVKLACKDTEAGYINASEPIELTFNYDNEIPEAQIMDGENSLISPTFYEGLFTTFVNSDKTLSLSVKDMPASAYASGVKSWGYAVLTLNSDKAFTEEEAQALIDDNDFGWTVVNDGIKTNVPLPLDGNYIVFVKVCDNVGNRKVYGSNGMILEDNNPNAVISLPENSAGMENQYSDAVEVGISATDSVISSGIKNVYLHVAENAESKLTAEEILNEKNISVLENAGVLNNGNIVALKKGEDSHTTTLVAVETEAAFTVTIDEAEGWDIASGTIQVVVEDYAGNYTMTEQDFVIDKTAPGIELKEYAGNIVNDIKYTSDDTTVEFVITEDNYTTDRVELTVVKNGTEVTANVMDFVSKVDGVSVEVDGKTIKITFIKSANYSVNLKCTDMAGLVSEESTAFVLDKTAPEMSVEYIFSDPENKENKRTDEEGVSYFNSNIKAVFTIEETNFNKGEKLPVININGEETVTENWESVGSGKFQYTVDMPADEIYKMSVSYTDPTNVRSVENVEGLVEKVVVDETAPTMTINTNKSTDMWYSFLDTITFGIIKQSTVEVTAVASDEHAEIVSFGYYCFDPVKEKDNKLVVEGLSRDALEDLEFTEYLAEGTKANSKTEAIDINANSRTVVYYRVENAAGVVAYYNTNGIIVDNKAPEVVENNSGKLKDGNVLYNDGKAEFTAVIEDPSDENYAYSGIKSITGQVYLTNITEGEEKTELILEKIESFEDQYDENGELTYSSDLSKGINKKCEFAIEIEKPVNEGYNKQVYVKLTIEDFAGNQFVTDNYVIAEDLTAPVIEISYGDAQNINHFSSDRTATITITEENFDPSKFEFSFNYIDADPAENETASKTYEYKYEDPEAKLVCGNEDWSEIEWKWVESKDPEVGTQHTATIIFDKEGDYSISEIKCVDIAGLENDGVITTANEHARNFVIDKEGADINISYGDEPLNGKYFSTARTATISFTERHFDLSNVVISYNYKKTAADKAGDFVYTYNDITGKFTDPVGNTLSVTLESAEGTEGTNGWTNKLSVDFIEEGYYVLDIEYVDYAGNHNKEIDKKTTPSDFDFVIDKTDPTGSVSINEGYNKYIVYDKANNEAKPSAEIFLRNEWNNDLCANITYDIFSMEDVKLTISGADDIAPIEDLKYIVSSDILTEDDLNKLPDSKWVTYVDDDLHSSSYEQITIPKDNHGVVYLKITNYAGRTTYVSSNGIIADGTKPTYGDEEAAPKISITNESSSLNGLFNENVELKVEVSDPVVNKTSSGLADVWYVVEAGAPDGNKTSEPGRFEITKPKEAFTGTITIDAATYDSNAVKVTVYAMDFAGNMSEKTIDLAIDVTAPVVSIAWNDAEAPALNGKYYNDTRVATITVEERNFDSNAVNIVVTSTDGTEIRNAWSSDANAGLLDTSKNTCTVEFPNDGDYTIEVSCVDKAGNVSNTVKSEEFTVDKTLPTISVAYNNNNAKNGKYYDNYRKATVTITEHNFNAAEVEEVITAALDGAGITAPVMSNFTSNGDVHTAIIEYNKEGDFTFDIAYSDLAGNPAADFEKQDFTIDKSKPEIKFISALEGGIDDKTANSGVVTPGFVATDINYDKEGVSITLVGSNNGTTYLSPDHANITNGEKIQYSDFSRVEEMDDLYTLTVIITDKAGNQDEKSIQFSVNRFGSVYVYGDDATRQYVDDVYHNEEQEIFIKEINVDTISESTVSMSRDGELKELVSGEDFTAVTNPNPENTGWEEIDYKLKAANFASEGSYKVTFASKDRAGNNMDNENIINTNVDECPVAFVIDKTDPTIVVGGVQDDKQYIDASRTMTVDAQDAIALKEVVITLNDEEIIYTVEVDEETGNKKPLKDSMNHQNEIKELITSSDKMQVIKIVATDMAGNDFVYGEKEHGDGGNPINVLITENLWIQYYMNKPLFYGSIGGVLLIAGVIIFLIAKKKKKEN